MWGTEASTPDVPVWGERPGSLGPSCRGGEAGCVCRMGSLPLPSTMAEETSCAPHLRGVHPTVQLIKRWRPTRWLDSLGQWERHAGPSVGKGGSSCCTRSAGLSDDVSHLCEVSQAAQTPAWASSSPQHPGSQAQRKGRKGFWEWQAVVVPVAGGGLGWRDSLLSEGLRWGRHQSGGGSS